MKETVTATGSVLIKKVDISGAIVSEALHNLVVTGGKKLLAKLLGGVSTQKINQIVFGTGTAATTASMSALTATTGPAYPITCTYPLDSVVESSVMFKASMAPGDGNGNTFTEMGLTTANGILFSRVLLSAPIAKTAEYALDVEWTISFQ
jgi:hypothetical protein